VKSDRQSLIETWRTIIVGEGKSWVLFKHGTCVVITNPTGDIKTQAIDLMKEWGKVTVATPSADFNVIGLRDDPGWVVTCHHPDILSYVGPDEVEGDTEPQGIVIGLLGRSKRGQDAEELEVVHAEHS